MSSALYPRRILLVLAALSSVAIALPSPLRAADPGSRPPNILLILADDLGWNDVGYQNPKILTPNIDSLAATGIRFRQHYVAPLCTPTRAALLSGRYPSRLGVYGLTGGQDFRLSGVTLADALRSCGYETAISGKWHLGSMRDARPRRHGFDHSYGALAGGVTPYSHRYKPGLHTYTWHRNDQLVSESGHVTDLITDEAVARVKAAASGRRPFFLYVPYTAPHIPIDEPDVWMKLYEGSDMSESRRRYAACVSHMDAGIGRILEALERTGQRESTMIIFFSDNGPSKEWDDPDGYPGPEKFPRMPNLGNSSPMRGMKGSVYEGGIRVPALVNWPGTLKPGWLETPVHVVDWMPTLCRLAGYKPPRAPSWDGRDIFPLLTGEVHGYAKPRTFYWNTGVLVAVRSGQWKMVIRDDRAELYDLSSDPTERHNVASQNEDIVAQLKKVYAKERRGDIPSI